MCMGAHKEVESKDDHSSSKECVPEDLLISSVLTLEQCDAPFLIAWGLLKISPSAVSSYLNNMTHLF